MQVDALVKQMRDERQVIAEGAMMGGGVTALALVIGYRAARAATEVTVEGTAVALCLIMFAVTPLAVLGSGLLRVRTLRVRAGTSVIAAVRVRGLQAMLATAVTLSAAVLAATPLYAQVPMTPAVDLATQALSILALTAAVVAGVLYYRWLTPTAVLHRLAAEATRPGGAGTAP
jgi:hypothetical protein